MMDTFFCLTILTKASMGDEEDDFTNQALEMIINNNALRKTLRPIILGVAFFNILIIILLGYVIYALNRGFNNNFKFIKMFSN